MTSTLRADRRVLAPLSMLCISLGCMQPAEPAKGAGAAAATGAGAAAETKSEAQATVDIHALETPKAVARALQDGAERLKNSQALQPSAGDYVAVFGPEYGPALEAKLRRAWAADKVQPGPWGPEQNEILVASATSEDFANMTPAAKSFPRGYLRIRGHMVPGHTFHAFRYVRSGEPSGAGYDALVRVGDRWRFFPKPWIAAEAGSKFFVPNAAEAVCTHIKQVELAGAEPYANCVHSMSRRAEDLGEAGFAAFSACVLALDANGSLDSCSAKAG